MDKNLVKVYASKFVRGKDGSPKVSCDVAVKNASDKRVAFKLMANQKDGILWAHPKSRGFVEPGHELFIKVDFFRRTKKPGQLVYSCFSSSGEIRSNVLELLTLVIKGSYKLTVPQTKEF